LNKVIVLEIKRRFKRCWSNVPGARRGAGKHGTGTGFPVPLVTTPPVRTVPAPRTSLCDNAIIIENDHKFIHRDIRLMFDCKPHMGVPQKIRSI